MSKQAARKAAQRAVPVMEKCELCGATGVRLERHHTDYENYKDVKVLCSRCHADIHGRRRQMAKCWVCGKEFYPSHSKRGHRVCSPECRSIFARISAMKRWYGDGQKSRQTPKGSQAV